MKSLLKFTLLFALIISGRLAKQATFTAVTPMPEVSAPPVVLVHQVLTSEPVKSPKPKPQVEQPGGSGLLAEMF